MSSKARPYAKVFCCMATLLIGKLIGQWETGINFEFGTARASKAKDGAISQLAGH